MKQKSRKRNGFTLIEMTIVLFIISLLILIIIPNISKARQSAQNVHQNAMVSLVKTQVGNYMDDNDNKDSITMQHLVDHGYLTSNQESKAKKYGIDVETDGTVTHDPSKSNS